ncbi:amidohydrolase family protein [Janthinobacterium agaricidamnosum]|uniref:2-pyrone-4,6-dicarboxylic acid hydrolase, putative n=1 Tax=Janthinobacterium agaricidamnosum NBRC 102515 = DSM 9628 TaxID=1349767 RepID=W0V6L1_9BURK|nr:amidohydrolase family protein [Janthinobacterium agaricidamnosum]CDG84449.1 2-pyrone-4,6-dicarboxylic acid hydrolase, putative [Janthinobacterium agaricidamnosum NBRC 102515 = DSM 9628]
MSTRRDFTFTLMRSAAGAALAPLAGCATTQRPTSMTAIDCHAHVFLHSLPMPDPRRAPAGYDATPETYLGLLDAHGMSHGVLVQPSFLGLDNSYLLSVLRAHPDRLRGIAVVAPGVTPQQLDDLQHAGVVGIRLNLVGLPTPDFSSPGWSALLRELAARDWQVEVHQLAQELKPVLDPLLAAGLKVVVDHFGRPGAALGVDDPGFRYLLSLGPSRRVWVKLSGAYRNGPHGRGEETARAAMPLLLSAFGVQRLMWGSDWPHTLFEKAAHYGAEKKLLEAWLPDREQRQAVLSDTPARLFRFTAA